MNYLTHGSDASCGDFDMLAEITKATLGCDMVFISISKHSRLHSVGLDLDTAKFESNRVHDALDTVCSTTVNRNETIQLEDATGDPAYSKLSYVSKGPIVAYLGVPLRAASPIAYGAVCAISKEAREWQEKEVEFLEQLSSLVSSLIAKELQRNEMELLHESLRVSDLVLMTLASEISTLVSIHNAKGSLLFSSLGLTRLASEKAIADTGFSLIKELSRDNSENAGSLVGSLGDSSAFTASLKLRSGIARMFETTLGPAGNGLYFLEWMPLENANLC